MRRKGTNKQTKQTRKRSERKTQKRREEGNERYVSSYSLSLSPCSHYLHSQSPVPIEKYNA
jgi:hypothetical protein